MGRGSRRGANAIEFALLAPVLIGMMGASVDYGLYFFQRNVVGVAGARASRMAAMAPAGQSTEVLQAEVDRQLQRWGRLAPRDVQVDATFDSSGTWVMTTRVTASFVGAVNIFPTPNQLTYTTSVRLEAEE